MVDQYASLYESFEWLVPTHFNIGHACCHRWANNPADARRIALFYEDEQGQREVWTYERLAATANQLANGLTRMGVKRGDRVAVILGQRPETVVAHIAIYSVGAVVLPLSNLFGPDALEQRLRDAQVRVAIFDDLSATNVLASLSRCPTLTQLVGIAVDDERVLAWPKLLVRQPSVFKPVTTRADEPAILLYTSGTTGSPKGALLPHSVLIGNLPGFVASQNWFPQAGDIFWSPADWAWTGGMMDALLPTLYFGHPIVGTRGRFSPERAFDILERYQVTNTFLFPTALKQMMKAIAQPQSTYKLSLRSIMSAGESVGDTVFSWCEQALGITPNEMFGQTEMNYLIGNSHQKWPARSGSMGKPYPGHQITVLREDGQVAATDEVGEVALNRLDIHGHPDPILFLGYWRNEAATLEKFTGDWCRTGDLARVDAQGYYWYAGRADDVFKSSGYRIGPGEIENSLLDHPAVANVAVVPKPDPERGAVVKAFVVLTPDFSSRRRAELTAILQEHVRARLAPYEYPKEIEYVDALPMTTTGKIQRRVLRQLEIGRSQRQAKKLKPS
ncbi:MAG: AMP-binding protein [Alcaligenaceae bacterium]